VGASGHAPTKPSIVSRLQRRSNDLRTRQRPWRAFLVASLRRRDPTPHCNAVQPPSRPGGAREPVAPALAAAPAHRRGGQGESPARRSRCACELSSGRANPIGARICDSGNASAATRRTLQDDCRFLLKMRGRRCVTSRRNPASIGVLLMKRRCGSALSLSPFRTSRTIPQPEYDRQEVALHPWPRQQTGRCCLDLKADPIGKPFHTSYLRLQIMMRSGFGPALSLRYDNYCPRVGASDAPKGP
jgi:hypothetical protein